MLGHVLSNSITKTSVDAWYFFLKLRRCSAINESSSQAMNDSNLRGEPSFELLVGRDSRYVIVTASILLTVWPYLECLVQLLTQMLLTHGLDQQCCQQRQLYVSSSHHHVLVQLIITLIIQQILYL